MQVPAPKRSHALFGPFEADLTSHELRHDGSKIKLQEMPFQVLAILLEHPGELVTREEFRQRLWPSDTFVDFEHSINTAVKKLREALQDDPDRPRYIETLPKLGYRFIAPLSQVQIEPEAAAHLVPNHSDVSPPVPPLRMRFRSYGVLVGAMLLVGVLLIGLNVGGVRDRLWRQRSFRSGLSLQINSLAVLPLQNLSNDPDQEYFADGLTDALITDLGKVSGLRVISRTSAMSYKKTSKPLPQIARELNVDAFVEGTVLRSGNQIRVTVQLVRASPEEHLWSERYERDVADVISLEKQLAVAIAHEITGHLSTAEETALSTNRTTNPKAYDAYLRGRYLWNDRTQQAASGAGAYFEQALREDPNFALAYSGLADYYTVSWGSWVDVPRGETYARKAVELRPELAETHASLGISAQYRCNFPEAGKELKRAVELNPNYAMGHHWYAIHLFTLGRLNDALAENDRARRLDPFSLPINFYRTNILGAMRQYDQALEQAEIISVLAPAHAHALLVGIYWGQDRIPEAIAEQKKDAELSIDPVAQRNYLDTVARVYARNGKQAALLKAAQLQEQACTNRSEPRKPGTLWCDPGSVAMAYEAVGDKDKTLYWLKRGLDQTRSSVNAQCWLGSILETGFTGSGLRFDSRFRELLRSLGLPE
jgi:TolB-like protein/DNA-binding winged helix-turn-helix (wHTH) protein